jgi:hypothetical protein
LAAQGAALQQTVNTHVPVAAALKDDVAELQVVDLSV